MRPAPLRLKHPSGWFAAGREVTEAMAVLSDAAFKLFLWLCLHADRNRGALRLDVQQIARVLGRTEAEVTEILRDLFLRGICSPAEDGSIEITDRFWPYERLATGPPSDDAAAYMTEVKRLMLGHACVQAAFPGADHKLALELYQCGIPIQQVERAIHLGCLRKYAVLLNHDGGAPITTLHYFVPLIQEVQRLNVSPGYWQYVALKLEKLERQWRRPLPNSVREPAACETK